MKLFVANISYSTTEADLAEHFGQFGQVLQASIKLDPDTGKSRGFAFIDMSSGGEAAMQGLNGINLDGRPLRIEECRSKERKPSLYSGGRGGAGGYGRAHRATMRGGRE